MRVETESAEGFQLDSTPHYFTVKNGETTKLTVTNAPISGILLHKISTADGEGIPGVSFILYDSGHNPIDQQTTDDRGYAWFEGLTESGTILSARTGKRGLYPGHPTPHRLRQGWGDHTGGVGKYPHHRANPDHQAVR